MPEEQESKGMFDFDLGETDYIEEPVSLTDEDKEEITNYQEELDKFKYKEILQETGRLTDTRDVYEASRKFLDNEPLIVNLDFINKENPERFYTIPGFNKDEIIIYHKLKTLFNKIPQKWLESGKKDPLVNEEGKIIHSLSKAVYDSFDVKFSGIESDLVKLFCGYAMKKNEVEIQKLRLKKILEPKKNEKKKIDLVGKILGCTMISAPFAAGTSYYFGVNPNDAFTSLMGLEAFLSIPYIYTLIKQKNKSNEIKELENGKPKETK